MSSQDDLNTSAIALIGMLGSVMVFAIIVLLVVVFYRTEADLRYVKDVNQPPVQVTDLLSGQQAELAEYNYDSTTKTYSIPIKRAMRLVVEDLAADPSSTGLGTPPPEAAPPAEPVEPTEEEGNDEQAES